jgi:hypothetical protein
MFICKELHIGVDGSTLTILSNFFASATSDKNTFRDFFLAKDGYRFKNLNTSKDFFVKKRHQSGTVTVWIAHAIGRRKCGL